VAFAVGEAIPVCGVILKVNLLGGPERGFGLLIHTPDIIVLDGKEDKTVRVCSEKWFRGKESFGFGGLMLRWWVEGGGGSCGFPRSTGRVDTEFVPIVTVGANEVGDYPEGLVRYGVL